MKLLSSFQRTLSYLPLGWLLLFVLFVLRVYLRIGKLPVYNNPDPESLGFDIHYYFLFFSMFITALSIFLWLPATIILAVRNKKTIYKADVIIYILFYLIVANFGRIAPWGLDIWFAD